jgi:hypothetical protein
MECNEKKGFDPPGWLIEALLYVGEIQAQNCLRASCDEN